MPSSQASTPRSSGTWPMLTMSRSAGHSTVLSSAQRHDHAFEALAADQLDDLTVSDQPDVGLGQALLRERIGAEGLAAMDDRHLGHRAQRERRVQRRVAAAHHHHVLRLDLVDRRQPVGEPLALEALLVGQARAGAA